MQYLITTKMTEQQTIKRLEELNIAYRSGEPLVSDQEYDKLVASLPEESEWFKKKEPGISSAGRTETLPIQMRSLKKLKSFEELSKWIAKIPFREDKNLVITPKYDGNSILLNESSGKAWTRGGEDNEGTIVTDHIKRLGIKLNPHCSLSGGEIIYSRATWKEDFEGKINPVSGEPFKTMRGTIAGALQSQKPEALDNISKAHYIRYNVFPDDLNMTYVRDIQMLNDSDYPLCQYHLRNADSVTEDLLNDLYNIWNNEYECDGLVICINDKVVWEIIGRQEGTGDPLYSMAYKANFEEKFKTKVVSVNGKVSKNGYLRPTVEIEPVYIQGAKVDNPTGNNMAFVFDQKLHPGAEIEIIRSGGVIPKIIRTIKANDELNKSHLDDIVSNGCPSCGGLLVWNESMTDLVCSNRKECKGVRLAKIVYFFDQMKFEEFGEATIETIFNSGYDSLCKILNINEIELLSIPGIGESTTENIISQIDRLFEIESGVVTLAKLMSALDCFEGIGETKAQKIIDFLPEHTLNKFADLDATADLILSHLSDKQKQEKTWISFINGLSNFYSLMEELMIPFSFEKTKKVVGGDLENVSVCFSGVRNDSLEASIKEKGGKIASGVSKKTTHLVLDSFDSTSSKNIKAIELGTTRLLIDEAIKIWM